MQCLYDHSKVEQQCTTKYQCILAMTEAVHTKDDFNLPWSDYTGDRQARLRLPGQGQV